MRRRPFSKNISLDLPLPQCLHLTNFLYPYSPRYNKLYILCSPNCMAWSKACLRPRWRLWTQAYKALYIGYCTWYLPSRSGLTMSGTAWILGICWGEHLSKGLVNKECDIFQYFFLYDFVYIGCSFHFLLYVLNYYVLCTCHFMFVMSLWLYLPIYVSLSRHILSIGGVFGVLRAQV